jgi:hypothetical protein|tara:strand:+ start:774 stop:1361 length:588 start_codon:yes stop_codon:yes gene_type:complete
MKLFVVILILTLLLFLVFEYKNKKIYYSTNFFEKFVHEKIKKDCLEFNSQLVDEDIPDNVKRKRFYIDPTHDIHKLLNSDEVKNKLGFGGYELSVDVPVEYRVYGMGGHMNWHSDTQLYDPEQYELIYTIDNTSDMTFNWKQPITGKIQSLEPKPNSILYVRANGAPHMVSEITDGFRYILKFVYVKPGSIYSPL